MTKLNIEGIINRFNELIVKKVGAADVLAKKREVLEGLKGVIAAARERVVSVEDICEVVKAAAKDIDNIELNDILIREFIGQVEGKRKGKGKAKVEVKSKKVEVKQAEVKKAPPLSIPTPPAKTGFFGA